MSEMKPLGLGRGRTGQCCRPRMWRRVRIVRMWRRDAGADVASPPPALGSETRTEVRTEGPLCLRCSHWASAEGAQGSAADHGGGGETQGADVASPLLP